MTNIINSLTVDISGWSQDDANTPYPEGTRDKITFISPSTIGDTRLLKGHRYLLKFSNPRYPCQFWSEIIASIIADGMAIPCPPTFYAVDPKSGQPGSLISWFYGEACEHADEKPDIGLNDAPEQPDNVPETFSLYVAGSSYMARLIKDFDFKKGKNHNLKSLSVWISKIRMDYKIDYWPHWISVFCFDAIIGNTDRHQDNWGILWRRWGSQFAIPRFSPAFDNGTSLLHEIVEEKLPLFNDLNHVDRYISRGRHHIRMDINDEKSASHISLIRDIVSSRENLAPVLQATLSFDENMLFQRIRNLAMIDSPVPLSALRIDTICQVVGRRIDLLREEFLR